MKSNKVSLGDFLSEFNQGNSTNAYEFMGCHKSASGGFTFRVWAPNARSVRLTGDFNFWDKDAFMDNIGYGVFELTVPSAKVYDSYKYYVEKSDGTFVYKCDPYGYHMCTRPDNDSKVYDLDGFKWTDKAYLTKNAKKDTLSSPVNIYEMHLGSWRKHQDGNFFSYRTIADDLVSYLKEMNYTHVELMPVSEYPFDPSWGYQVTGYYAPTSRYGTPHDFMYLVNKCHEAGIGVIIDWVGAHFPKDEYGLIEFDGTCCYESNDYVMNEHPDWNTRIFNYGRNEVRSFLISNVLYWLDKYHVDGIRVDAVASMLYLDYGRGGREWHPNYFGGKENLEAINFMRKMNAAAFAFKPSVMMIAEESTIFPMVTKPDYMGGLGFNYKWNMGWMNDMLKYISNDPLFRKSIHGTLTHSFSYAFTENYILPLSHDEVVHGKCSMIGKMPGVYEDKFSNLRAFYAYMMAHPGKKLTFMGSEFAQFIEWDFKKELDWFLLSVDSHRKTQRFIKDLNKFYLENPPLYEMDTDPEGFSWISGDDADQSIITFRRIDKKGDELICICNFCPVRRDRYRIGIPYGKKITPVFSSDYRKYGGTGTPLRTVPVKAIPYHGLENSSEVTIPPMCVTFYKIVK
ncbi:MAG: 1,4-alpha-glucan branching protein GlgB [Clostridia bacterium]|nr:1,4-alpha-glucan branching protein GlgB [Clostridia bacterium]